MMHWRCKCGDKQGFGSTGPRRCDWCPKCETTLAYGPDGHKTVRPAHRMVQRHDERLVRLLAGLKVTAKALEDHPEGKNVQAMIASTEKELMICAHCFKSAEDLEKSGEPMEAWQ